MNKLIFTSLIALLSFTAMAQDKKVAVFDPAGNADNAVKEIIREMISSVVVNTNGYEVLERQLINRVLEEHRLQIGGLVDDSQVVEMGKLMGANVAFVTSVTGLGSNFFISVKMIDVQTARIEKQNTGQSQRGMDDLINVVQTVVGSMVGPVSAPPPLTGEPAIIHLYRPRRALTILSVQYDVVLDNASIGRTANNWKTTVTVSEFGAKTLSATIEGRKAEVNLNILPGGVYYVRCDTSSEIVDTGRTRSSTDRAGRIVTAAITNTLYTPTLQLVDKSIGETEFNAIVVR